MEKERDGGTEGWRNKGIKEQRDEETKEWIKAHSDRGRKW